MNRIVITLDDQTRNALELLADKEFRGPHAQAAFIIHKELEKQGLITVTKSPIIRKDKDKNVTTRT